MDSGAGGDTIFALATGGARAALAIVRISGPQAGFVLQRLAGAPLPVPRRLSLRRLRALDGDLLDEALVVWLPGPGTATGEDTVELHLHGGPAVRAAVLRALAAEPALRMAQPGEFTRRAFRNGRLDLTAAEGIADLVEAETEAQRRQALRQLDGALGRRVAAWRETAIDLLASAEAALDFSDEGDVDASGLDQALRGQVCALRDALAQALSDGRRGERVREGFTVVLAGPPNAGKSTLLNTLSGRDAAITSPLPGTTRDVIEVHCDLGGWPMTLVDTAGLRDTGEPVEAEGVARARRRIAQADLVLILWPPDAAYPEPSLLDDKTPHLVVRTKCDLMRGPLGDGADDGLLSISATTGQGLDGLLDRLGQEAGAGVAGEAALITRQRHREALERARFHLECVCTAKEGMLPELIAEDLRLAVRALGEIGGYVGVETMLDRLFSSFCIGK